MRADVTLIGVLPPIKGGISPYCKELLDSLSDKIDVDFIGFKRLYPNFLYPGESTYRLKGIVTHAPDVKEMISWHNPFSWIKTGLLAKGKIIHVQWWSYILAPVYLTFLSIMKIRNKKIILTLHNVLPHERSKISDFLNSIVLSFGDYFIVHSESNRKKLMELFKINRSNISVIPYGILKPKNIMGISKLKAKEKFGLKKDKKVLLFFGYIRPYKGLDILLNALSFIIKEVDDVILLIAGECWEDWDKYDKIITDKQLSNHVLPKIHFIPDDEIECCFQAADLVVLPYKHFDSQSAVGALALPFNKPQIVTNVGGLIDFVKDKRAIAEPNNPNDLSTKIIQILKQKELYNKLCSDSEDIVKEYSWDNIAEMTVGLYSRLNNENSTYD